MKKLALAVLLITIGPAFGAAGKAVFVAGSVAAEGPKPRAIVAGTEVDLGDTIVTAAKSRAQLAMNDGQRYALRAGTRFRIDAFSLPPAVRNGAQATAVAADGQSFFTLQKGGFRAVSGAIGKNDSAAYEVRTPVGTLGIRGTTWAAVFCRDDCDDAPGLAPGQPIRNGLYLGVDRGRIRFSGRGLDFELNEGEFAFIALDEVPVERLREPPAWLRGDGAGPLEIADKGPRTPVQALAKPGDFIDRRSPAEVRDPADIDPQPASGEQVDQGIAAQGPRGAVVDLTGGGNPGQRSLAYAFTGGQTPLVNSGSTLVSVMVFDANGNLIGFTTPNGALQSYAIGTAVQASLGSSAETGIRWGRWTGGNATLTTPGAANQTLNLSQQSLPWIIGSETAGATVLPISGTRSYVLVGGTNPTDSLGTGNVGTLGGAFLAADFTNRSVTATLTLDIANSNWWATGTAPIVSGTNQFAGNFSDVRIGGVTGNTGSLAGFLTEAQAGVATAAGAGFTYFLTDVTGQRGTVSGAVALREGQGVPPPPPPPPGNRSVAFVLGDYQVGGRSQSYTTSAANPTGQYQLDANGNLTRFDARNPLDAADTYSINTSTNLNTGFDAGTGLRWGRWSSGSATSLNGPPQNLAAQSLHWILGSAYTGAPTLPQAGSGYLTLVGNTAPGDTRGNIGTLGGASFFVDFTNLTLQYSVIASIDGRVWYGTGAGALAAGSREFGGNFDLGNVGNLAVASGAYSGFIVVPAAGGPANLGAGLSWWLNSTGGIVGVVSGATAFSAAGSGFPQGGGAAIAPPAQQRRDIAFSAAGLRSAAATSNAASEYARGGFDLTRFRALILPGQASVPLLGEFDVGSSSSQDQGFDLRGMLRWGRWSGGTAQLTSPPGAGNPIPIDLAANSIHWITSADSANAPVLPTTGTASYTWIGGTNPTNQANEAGTLNTATFAADFTNATVAASINASFSDAAWIGAGNGTITGGTNLFTGALNGTYTQVATGLQLPAFGSFNGFFTGPQDPAGVPNGVGLSFEMTEGQNQASVNGVAGFVARP